jgi:toxin ParE1/3/4
MAVKLLWTPRAEEDLREIYSLIALDSPAAADRILLQLQSRIEMLAANPRICQRRSDIAPSARILIEYPYLVLYEIHPDSGEGPIAAVEIVRIVDGRRSLKNLF